VFSPAVSISLSDEFDVVDAVVTVSLCSKTLQLCVLLRFFFSPNFFEFCSENYNNVQNEIVISSFQKVYFLFFSKRTPR
jgi:hypothetical protein